MATTALQIVNSTGTIVSSATLKQETFRMEEGPNYGPALHYDTRVRRVKGTYSGDSFKKNTEITHSQNVNLIATYLDEETIGADLYIYFYYKKSISGYYEGNFTSSMIINGTNTAGDPVNFIASGSSEALQDTSYVPYTNISSGMSWAHPPNIWSDVLTIGALQSRNETSTATESTKQETFSIHDYIKNDKIVFNPLLIFDRFNSIPDQDRLGYKESITSKDLVKNSGITPLVGTPDRDVPWFYSKLSFTDNLKTVYATYGRDTLITRPSLETQLYRGIILNGVSIQKDIGNAIYGSLVFPTVSLDFDNTEGDFDFLKDNPEIAYSGVCHVNRWDVISQKLVHEYAGVVTGYRRANKKVSFDLAIIGAHVFDKTLPIDTSEVIDQNLIADSGVVLGRFFGRCNNVACVNIKKTDIGEYPIDYKYHAGWGRNLITKVFRSSLQVPTIAEDPYGYTLLYDDTSNQTIVSFTGAEQLDYSITAHIEGLRTPEHNLLKATQEFEGTDSNGADYWTKAATNVVAKDNIFFNMDGRKTASYFAAGDFPNSQGSDDSLTQNVTLTKDAPNGLIAYALIRDVDESERGYARDNGIEAIPNIKSVSNSLTQTDGFLTIVELIIDGTTHTPYNNTNMSGNYHGLISLGNKWYIRWLKVNSNISANTLVQFRLRQSQYRFSQWVGGTYLAIDTKDSSEWPVGLSQAQADALIEHVPYEQVFGYRSDQDIEGYASSRNFAYNIKDVLTSSYYGLDDLTVDQESFDKAAHYLWSNFYFCDGPLDEKRQATQVLNDLLMAGNMRLERSGIFREWKLFTDQARPDSTTNKIGRGDSYNINNIVEVRDLQSNSINDYPKELKFPCVPIRDAFGAFDKYKRIRERKDLVSKYGRTITLTNMFVRYEITADVILENVKNKLLNSFQTFDITLKEDFAWNLEIDEVVAFYDPILGLDDVIDNGDTIQPLFEITSISKSEESVKITIRNFKNTTYDYTGTYPVDRDGDNLFIVRQTPIAGNPSSPPITLPISSSAGAAVPGPGSFAAHLFVRTTGQANGQELVVAFSDGTEVVLAKSVTGSLPTDMNTIKRQEKLKFHDPLRSNFPRINAPENEVTTFINGAAIINEAKVPTVDIDGISLNVRLMKDSDEFEAISRFDSPDTVLLYAYDQKILGHPDFVDSDINIHYEMNTEPSNYIYTGTEYGVDNINSITHKYNLINLSGDFIRGMKYTAGLVDNNEHWGVCRRFRDLSITTAKVYRFMLFNHYHKRRSAVGSQEIMLTARQFSPQGGPEKEFVFGNLSFVIDPIPPDALREDSRQAFDISSDGTPYAIVSTAGSGSWLCRLIDIGDVEGSYDNYEDGNLTAADSLSMRNSEITGLVGGLEVVACAWDTNKDELHVCVTGQTLSGLTTDEKVHVLKLNDTDVVGNNYLGVTHVREYIIGYNVHSYTYDEDNDVFYATVELTNDLTPQEGILVISPDGTFQNPGGQPLSNPDWSIKDVTGGLDGFVYLTYTELNTTTSLNELKIARISYHHLVGSGLSAADTFYTRSEAIESLEDSRAFINVIPLGNPLDTTQIQ